MGQFGFGQSVRRVEDARLLTGHGRYTDDINLPRQVHGVVVRSPHAHAEITGIDSDDAIAAPGVLAVFTGDDVAADGLGNIPCVIPLKSRDGSPLVIPPYPALAQGRVRHVGQAVAFVVAETLQEAQDAAELVMVDYDSLDAVVDTREAAAPGALQIWDEAPGNQSFDWGFGDEAGTEKAFDTAATVVDVELINNRVVVNAMENRAALGDFDPLTGKHTLYTGTQGVHGMRDMLAAHVLKLPPSQVRVVNYDVGGGFGMKNFIFPEQVLCVYAARKLGRPVKWNNSRSESFTSDSQGRDHVTQVKLALDADNRIIGLHCDTIAAMGAYLSNFAPFIPTLLYAPMLPGAYTIPTIYCRVRGIFTNTLPTDAYRGAGRPEATYVIERAMDAAAIQIGMDPAEFRRINFIRQDQMPFETPGGLKYDSGDFHTCLDTALDRADRSGLPQRKAEGLKHGKLVGQGIAYYVEGCSGGNEEQATLTFDVSGRLTLEIGTQSNGQGHETAYAQIAADALGIPIETITVVQGDSDRVVFGKGTGGSRSGPVGGAATAVASENLIGKAKKLAAHFMEAAEADIEFADGTFTVAGTDRTMDIGKVVEQSFLTARLPAGAEPGLSAGGSFVPPSKTFPNGAHVCELEIDADTGTVEITRYTVVDDLGVVLNPMLVAGQVHGGVAQGIGQALLERTIYDESGQLLTGSFMDYCMPRADNLPFLDFSMQPTRCTTNLLGMKGCGEAGTIGACAAVINALLDALQDVGVTRLDMPATPDVLWSVLQSHKAAAE